MGWTPRDHLLLAELVLKHGNQNWPVVSRGMKLHSKSPLPDEAFSSKECARQYSTMIDRVGTPKRSRRGEKDESVRLETQIYTDALASHLRALEGLVVEDRALWSLLQSDLELLENPRTSMVELRSKLNQIRRSDTTEAQQDQIRDKRIQHAKQTSGRGAMRTSSRGSSPGPRASEVALAAAGAHTNKPPFTPTTPTKMSSVLTLASDATPVTKVEAEDDLKSAVQQGQEASEAAGQPESTGDRVSEVPTGSATEQHASIKKEEPEEEAKPASAQPTPSRGRGRGRGGRRGRRGRGGSRLAQLKGETEETGASPPPTRSSAKGSPASAAKPEATTPSSTSRRSRRSTRSEGASPLPTSRATRHRRGEEGTSETSSVVSSRPASPDRQALSRTRTPESAASIAGAIKPIKPDLKVDESDSDDEPLVAREQFMDDWELVEKDDTEEVERRQRAWRASILQVWRQIAGHRDANIFQHPVKEEHAPGYYDVVKRPMDLATIKHKIDAGEITTTLGFEHAIKLMLNNAIMYNAKEHFVHQAAQTMRADCMAAISNFRQAVLGVRASEQEALERQLRGGTVTTPVTGRRKRKDSDTDLPTRKKAKRDSPRS